MLCLTLVLPRRLTLVLPLELVLLLPVLLLLALPVLVLLRLVFVAPADVASAGGTAWTASPFSTHTTDPQATPASPSSGGSWKSVSKRIPPPKTVTNPGVRCNRFVMSRGREGGTDGLVWEPWWAKRKAICMIQIDTWYDTCNSQHWIRTGYALDIGSVYLFIYTRYQV